MLWGHSYADMRKRASVIGDSQQAFLYALIKVPGEIWWYGII